MKLVLRFIKAVFKYIYGGMKNVTHEEYKARLLTCNKCEFRKGGICAVCGCVLLRKAKWATEDCPKGRWTKI